MTDPNATKHPQEGLKPRAAAGAPQQPPIRIHPIQSLRRHSWLALLMLVCVAAIAYLVLDKKLNQLVYRSEATLLVSPVFARNLTEDREFQVPNSNFQQFVQQQIVMITQPDTVLNALDRLGGRRSLWQRPGESPQQAAARLGADLKVVRVPDTSYVTVGLEGERPEGLSDVVNAVVEAYLARTKTQPFHGMDVRMEALNRRKTELQEEIRAKMDLLARWAKEQGVPDFEANPHQAARADMEHALDAARVRRVDAEARLAALLARHESLKALNADMEARTQLGADPELTGLRNLFLTRKNDLKTKVMGLTAEHEGRQIIERQITEIDAELEKAEKSTFDRIRAALAQRREAQMKEAGQSAEAEVEHAKRYEQTIAAEAAALAEKVARYNKIYFDAQVVRHDLDRARKQMDAVSDRLDFIRLETNAPGFVHLVSPAFPPVEPMPGKAMKWIALFAAAAVGLALAAPTLLDAAAPRIRTLADLEDAAEARALGWVPERRRRNEPLVREQVRRLAVALDRERRQNQRTCFAFTSIAPGAGTTQLVLDLGQELRLMGVRVLAIEANALKSDARFGSAGKPGLADALLSGVKPDKIVIPASDILPDRIARGRARTRTLASTAGAIRTFLSQFDGRYDLTLFDAPPVLRSSDAELLAGAADATILVVRAGKTSTGEVKRALQALRRSTPNAIGLVLNRVRGM